MPKNFTVEGKFTIDLYQVKAIKYEASTQSIIVVWKDPKAQDTYVDGTPDDFAKLQKALE